MAALKTVQNVLSNATDVFVSIEMQSMCMRFIQYVYKSYIRMRDVVKLYYKIKNKRNIKNDSKMKL